jgi:hypothetical protein
MAISASRPVPPEEQCLPVPVSYWKELMKRVERCRDSSSFHETLGWTCLGVAGSALLSAVTFFFGIEFVRYPARGVAEVNWGALVAEFVCSTLFLAGLGVGCAALLYARRHRQDRADLRQIIVKDMERFHDRLITPRRAAAAEPPDNK